MPYNFDLIGKIWDQCQSLDDFMVIYEIIFASSIIQRSEQSFAAGIKCSLTPEGVRELAVTTLGDKQRQNKKENTVHYSARGWKPLVIVTPKGATFKWCIFD